MNKLVDLEICKRIAEIEGISLSDKPNDMTGNLETIYPPYMSYNPLTDDTLCFQLMVKYRVWRWSNPRKGKYNAVIKDVQGWVSGETLNEAICLAIIEKHKGE